MELQIMINEEIRDLIKLFEDLMKDEKVSETFKSFIIVKLVLTLRSIILIKKLYLLYHKFSL